MKPGKKSKENDTHTYHQVLIPEWRNHGRIFSSTDQDKCLDSIQLEQLEQSFREWTEAAKRFDVRVSRRRVFLIFLLIRYTGAKLNEVLNLDPDKDIDFEKQILIFGRKQKRANRQPRKVQISGSLCREIQEIISEPLMKKETPDLLKVDPGFVRRKFYDRAEASGIAKQLGAPEILRKSRAVELMRNNMPLPAVQMMLGHSTPNLTSAYVSFSDENIRELTRFYLERESSHKTSARNVFFGKIGTIRQGDIQSRVELITIEGHSLVTVITNDSLERLGLKKGRLVTAEVKAPWITLQKGTEKPVSSAENIFQGVIAHITRGEVASEYVLRIAEGNELCAIVSSESGKKLYLREQDQVWALFNSYSVVLHLD